MTAMSDFLENSLLDHVLRAVAYTPPATIYAALFTAAPDDVGGGTEASGFGYARQAVSFGAASAGDASNTALVEITPVGGDWGTITHAALFDALVDGNMLFHGALSVPKLTADGDPVQFAIGNLTIGLD